MLRLRRQQTGILDGQGGDILGTPRDRWSALLERTQPHNGVALGGSRYAGDDEPIATVSPDDLAINVQPTVNPNQRTISDITPEEEARYREMQMSVAPNANIDPNAVQNDAAPTNPMVVMPQPSKAQQDLNALNKDYSITKDENGNVIGRGKDRDKTHNWKDILRSAGLGALSGLQSGGLGGALGGAIAGTVRGAIDRNYDDKMQNEMFVRPRLEAQVQRERQEQAWQQQQEYERARTEAMTVKPQIEAGKLLNQERTTLLRQYNSLPSFNDTDADDKAFGDAYQKVFGFRPPLKNADTKSTQIVDQRDGQVYIMQTDKQGNSKVIRVMNDDGTPMKIESKDMLASADRALQRSLDAAIQNSKNVTNLKVAQINAGSRERQVQMQQQGANARTVASLAASRQTHLELLAERAKQNKAGNEAKVREIDARIAAAKARAIEAGLTQDEMTQVFGGQ